MYGWMVMMDGWMVIMDGDDGWMDRWIYINLFLTIVMT